jgi:hypothetical protein
MAADGNFIIVCVCFICAVDFRSELIHDFFISKPNSTFSVKRVRAMPNWYNPYFRSLDFFTFLDILYELLLHVALAHFD